MECFNVKKKTVSAESVRSNCRTQLWLRAVAEYSIGHSMNVDSTSKQV